MAAPFGMSWTWKREKTGSKMIHPVDPSEGHEVKAEFGGSAIQVPVVYDTMSCLEYF